MAEKNPESRARLVALLKELRVPHYDAGGQVVKNDPGSQVDAQGQKVGTQSTVPDQGSFPTMRQTGDSFSRMSYDPQGAAQSGVNMIGNGFRDMGAAFTAQNGYQAGIAPTTQTDYTRAIGQAGNNSIGGYGNFQQNQMQQQQLADQYGQQAMGHGPNPAQAALNQNTGNNVAAQNALMAGQRGAGANAGMMARQAGQAGAGVRQSAIAQAATLQAQQSLAAQQQQAALFGQMGAQNIAEQQANTQMFSAATGAQNAQNAGQIQNYGQMQGINSTIAQNNANAVNQTTGGILGGAASIASMFSDENVKKDIKPAGGKIKEFLDNAGAHEYSYDSSVQGKPGAAPGRHIGPMAQELEKSELGQQMVTNTPQGKMVDFQHSMGTMVASLSELNKRLEALEGGGKKMAQGGEVEQQPDAGAGFKSNATSGAMPYAPPGLASVPMGEGVAGGIPSISKMMGGQMGAGGVAMAEGGPVSFAGRHLNGYAHGGQVNAMVSPEEIYLNPREAREVAGNQDKAKRILPHAKHIPGKAKVKGNSYSNDTVPAKLEEGGVVIPRTVANSKNLSASAAKFVAAALARKGGKK